MIYDCGVFKPSSGDDLNIGVSGKVKRQKYLTFADAFADIHVVQQALGNDDPSTGHP